MSEQESLTQGAEEAGTPPFAFPRFDAEGPPHGAPEADAPFTAFGSDQPVVHQFSEQELTALKEQCVAQGKEAGLAEGLAQGKGEHHQVETMLGAALQQSLSQWETMEQRYREAIENFVQCSTKLAADVARVVAGDALQADPLPRMEAFVTQCIPLLLPQPEIAITLHPDLEEPLKTRLLPALEQQGYSGTVRWESDAACAMTDLQMRFEGTNIAVDSAALWQEIYRTLGLEVPAQEALGASASQASADAEAEDVGAEARSDAGNDVAAHNDASSGEESAATPDQTEGEHADPDAAAEEA